LSNPALRYLNYGYAGCNASLIGTEFIFVVNELEGFAGHGMSLLCTLAVMQTDAEYFN